MSFHKDMRICAKCEVEFRPKKNGVHLVEMATFGPVAIWQADLWACPECDAEIVVGLGDRPWIRHYEPGFALKMALCHSRGRVIPAWLNQREREEALAAGNGV